jgi:hypothetical protein
MRWSMLVLLALGVTGRAAAGEPGRLSGLMKKVFPSRRTAQDVGVPSALTERANALLDQQRERVRAATDVLSVGVRHVGGVQFLSRNLKPLGPRPSAGSLAEASQAVKTAIDEMNHVRAAARTHLATTLQRPESAITDSDVDSTLGRGWRDQTHELAMAEIDRSRLTVPKALAALPVWRALKINNALSAIGFGDEHAIRDGQGRRLSTDQVLEHVATGRPVTIQHAPVVKGWEDSGEFEMRRTRQVVLGEAHTFNDVDSLARWLRVEE